MFTITDSMLKGGGGRSLFLVIYFGRVVVPFPNSYKPFQAGLMGSYTVNENNIDSAVSEIL